MMGFKSCFFFYIISSDLLQNYENYDFLIIIINTKSKFHHETEFYFLKFVFFSCPNKDEADSSKSVYSVKLSTKPSSLTR